MKAIAFGIALFMTTWAAISITGIQAVLISFLLNLAWPEVVNIKQVWCCLMCPVVFVLPLLLPAIWRWSSEWAANYQK